MKQQLNEKLSLQKIAGIIKEAQTENVPEIINAMKDLKSSLDKNLEQSDLDLVDFDEITQYIRILLSNIKKYR